MLESFGVSFRAAFSSFDLGRWPQNVRVPLALNVTGPIGHWKDRTEGHTATATTLHFAFEKERDCAVALVCAFEESCPCCYLTLDYIHISVIYPFKVVVSQLHTDSATQ